MKKATLRWKIWTHPKERNGYKPICTNPDHELKLHTAREMSTGENENKYLETENIAVRRSNRKCMQPSRYRSV